jgi:hypothetical protein
MPIPNQNFTGNILISYAQIKKDLYNIKYNGWNEFEFDIIDVINNIKIIKCNLNNDNILNIDNILYKYSIVNDFFYKLNCDSSDINDKYVRILAIYDECNYCKLEEYLIPYENNWVCDGCIIDEEDIKKWS